MLSTRAAATLTVNDSASVREIRVYGARPACPNSRLAVVDERVLGRSLIALKPQFYRMFMFPPADNDEETGVVAVDSYSQIHGDDDHNTSKIHDTTVRRKVADLL